MVRTVIQHKRRCSKSGRRTEGAAYLVSEPSENGILPIIVVLDDPIPFRPPSDKPLGRQPIEINLDALLEGAAYEEFIAGASAERYKSERLKEPELLAFGMPLRDRTCFGICRSDGLEALKDVAPKDIRGTGRHLRNLTRGSGDQEVARAWAAFSDRNWLGVLASLHRAWRKYSPEKRERMAPYFWPVFMSLNATDDAIDLP